MSEGVSYSPQEQKYISRMEDSDDYEERTDAYQLKALEQVEHRGIEERKEQESYDATGQKHDAKQELKKEIQLRILQVDYDNLPDWVVKDSLSDNGNGKEYATYIVIEDGDYKAVYSDAMEPEDARFYRDLKWIQKELSRISNRR